MNKAQIVRDDNGKVYLKVTGKPLDKAIYFCVEEFATRPQTGEITKLSQEFDINLTGRK